LQTSASQKSPWKISVSEKLHGMVSTGRFALSEGILVNACIFSIQMEAVYAFHTVLYN